MDTSLTTRRTRLAAATRCARCGGEGHTAPHCPWPDESSSREGRRSPESLAITRAVWKQIGVSFLALLACIVVAALCGGVQ